jgi:hypothetical protein
MSIGGDRIERDCPHIHASCDARPQAVARNRHSRQRRRRSRPRRTAQQGTARGAMAGHRSPPRAATDRRCAVRAQCDPPPRTPSSRERYKTAVRPCLSQRSANRDHRAPMSTLRSCKRQSNAEASASSDIARDQAICVSYTASADGASSASRKNKARCQARWTAKPVSIHADSFAARNSIPSLPRPCISMTCTMACMAPGCRGSTSNARRAIFSARRY